MHYSSNICCGQRRKIKSSSTVAQTKPGQTGDGKQPRVAVLSGGLDTYAREVVLGIHDYLSEHSPWSIYVPESRHGDNIPEWIRKWTGQGIIARIQEEKISRAILKSDLPAVDVGFGMRRSPFPRVILDGRVITKMAADHLLERGFSSFGYCGINHNDWSRFWGDLFAKHVEEAGYTCHSFKGKPLKRRVQRWALEVESIGRWLRELPKPIGIMGCCDERAQQVLEACRRLKIPVPEQVAVIGVYNDEPLCGICDPPLSSVITNARRVGYQAAALLERLMSGQPVRAASILFEPVGVANRESTDVLAVADATVSKAAHFIRERACDGVTLEDVLKEIRVSRASLDRSFKKFLKCTPQEHIIKVRLNRARSLLVDTHLSLAEIAERTGFKHLDHLSTAFSQCMGNSLRDYRPEHRV